MKIIKIINFILFITFISFLIKWDFSNEFIVQKKKMRNNYALFLSKVINDIETIKTKKNFKEFKDNKEYLKKNIEEKEFWKLLKTK